MAQSMYTYDDLGTTLAEARGLSVKFLKNSGLVEIKFEARTGYDSYIQVFLKYDQDQDGTADDNIRAGHLNVGVSGYPIGFESLVPTADYVYGTPTKTTTTIQFDSSTDWRQYKFYWLPFTTSETEALGGEPLEERTVKFNPRITDAAANTLIDVTMDLDIDLRPALTNTTFKRGADTYISFEEPTVKKVVRARPKIYINTSASRSTATQLNTGDYVSSSSWGLERSLDGGNTYYSFQTESDNNVWLKKGVKIGDYPPSTDADLDMGNLDNFYFEDQVFRENTQQTTDTFYWIELNTKIAEETY